MSKLLLISAFVALTCAAPPAPRLDGRIVGGEPADIEDYPYQLSLEFYGAHICGASIIGIKYALTAAHCTEGISASALSVRAGSTIRESGGQVVSVRRIFQHPSYIKKTKDYDISVLELTSYLSLGLSAQKIRLADRDQDVPAGSKSVVAGWGSLKEQGSLPTTLQVVSFPILSLRECRSAYTPEAVTDRMICAGDLGVGGKDTCQGDSGGPLIVAGRQVGVVSWGVGCARPEYPGVYASVPKLRSYIEQVSGI